MTGKFGSHVRSNVVGYVALFFALGLGTTYAADKIGSQEIAKNAVKSKHLKNLGVKNKDLATNSVTSPKVTDGSLLSEDFSPEALSGLAGTPGPKGEQGTQGERGPPGTQGPAGRDGSPDTSQEVRDKLLQVDGSGSGIDADTVDGVSAGAFAADSDLHTPARVAVNDLSPGNEHPFAQQLLSHNGVNVIADCADNLQPDGRDRALISVGVAAGGSVSSVTSDQTMPFHEGINSPTDGGFILDVDQPDGGTGVESAHFIAVTTSGQIVSGIVGAEVNDSATGTDCTFALTAIG